MRNRVARKAAQPRAAVTSTLARMSVVLTLVPFVLVVAAQAASARTLAAEEVAADGVSGLAGPVGIAAVVVGFGGLVAGLLRHRRREAAPLPVIDHQRPASEPAGGERAA